MAKVPISARTRLGLRMSKAGCFISARTEEGVSGSGEPRFRRRDPAQDGCGLRRRVLGRALLPAG